MGSSKKQTIGYRYFMGLHFGLCHGPVDALLEIRGGDRTAWDGSAVVLKHYAGTGPDIVIVPETGPITASQRITVHSPNLWGGEKKEGGIVGELDVMMGEDTQQPNDYLVSQLGATVPGFRGMLSLVFRKGMVGAMNPYPKPWKFKVRRILNGWHGGAPWHPESAEIVVAGNDGVPATDPILVATFSISGGVGNIGHIVDTSQLRTLPKNVLMKIEPPTNPDDDTIPRRIIASVGGVTVWDSGWLGHSAHQSALDTLLIESGNTSLLGPIMNGNETSGLVTLPGESNVVSIRGLGANPIYPNNENWHLIFTAHTPGNPGSSPTYVYAMNPAHIAYEALTNPDWGLGYPPATIDLSSFAAAADVFYNEGMGLCGQWTRQDTIEGFIQDVMNHAGAALAQDPRTALFRLLPIRGDYIVADLQPFARGLNVISVESFERAAVTESVNEVVVQYVDATNGKDGVVTVQHLANIQAQGGVASQTIRYPLAPTASLAQRLAQRDLTAKSQPLCKVRLVVDRSAYGILPGEVVRWSDSKLGIIDMPMRVLQVNYGNLTSGAITMDLAEDVFGLPATTYVGQQESGWQEPNGDPQPSPVAVAFEAPYVGLHRDQGAGAVGDLDSNSGFLAMAAARPPGVSYGFSLYTNTAGAGYEESAASEWTPTGILSIDIGPDNTTIPLGSASGLETVTAGDLAMIGSNDTTSELVRIDAVDISGGSVSVGRGCADTLPKAWPLGTRLWIIEDDAAGSVTEFATGEVVYAKAVTRASGGELPLASAPTDGVVMRQRQYRPYPPGLFRINGEAAPVDLSGLITVTWAHRDRLLQADQLIDQEAASIGPEPGTTYTMRTYLDGVLVNTQPGIATNTAEVLPGGNGAVRVELEAVRDAVSSWHMHVREFEYSTGPTNNRVTVSGDRRVTVAGNGRNSIG